MHNSELSGKTLPFLFLLWFLWFSNMCTRTIFAPILPLLEDEFLITHAKASSIFMFQALGYGLAMFFSGFFAGTIGYKKSIVVSLFVSSAVFFLIPFVKVFSLLYLFSFFLGLSGGVYTPSAIPLITEYFAEKDWGKTLAIHDSGAPVSIFSIPLITIFLLKFLKWRGIFTVFAVAFLFTAIIFQLVCNEVKLGRSEKYVFKDLLKTRTLWTMGAIFTFVSGANMGIYSIIPLYFTKELSMSIEHANAILGISKLGGIVIAILFGFVVDRVNLKKVLFITTVSTGILTVLMGAAQVGHVGIFLFFQTIFVAGFFPAGVVCIARMFSRETRSMATGFILTFSIIGGVGVVPYLLGISGDLISFRFGIVIIGGLVCLSSFLVFSLRELK